MCIVDTLLRLGLSPEHIAILTPYNIQLDRYNLAFYKYISKAPRETTHAALDKLIIQMVDNI